MEILYQGKFAHHDICSRLQFKRLLSDPELVFVSDLQRDTISDQHNLLVLMLDSHSTQSYKRFKGV